MFNKLLKRVSRVALGATPIPTTKASDGTPASSDFQEKCSSIAPVDLPSGPRRALQQAPGSSSPIGGYALHD
ncbi:UNVERIFIED_CONTAM: hypothetical protein Sangu_3063400 [Sesamum angustifolium]|uniref:Uncharacterized protein n=1 Tax=Sesamum angustifolium TaxID=2727405 RepID=A0AAW2KET1_9LAMI